MYNTTCQIVADGGHCHIAKQCLCPLKCMVQVSWSAVSTLLQIETTHHILLPNFSNSRWYAVHQKISEIDKGDCSRGEARIDASRGINTNAVCLLPTYTDSSIKSNAKISTSSLCLSLRHGF